MLPGGCFMLQAGVLHASIAAWSILVGSSCLEEGGLGGGMSLTHQAYSWLVGAQPISGQSCHFPLYFICLLQWWEGSSSLCKSLTCCANVAAKCQSCCCQHCSVQTTLSGLGWWPSSLPSTGGDDLRQHELLQWCVVGQLACCCVGACSRNCLVWAAL